MKESKDFSRKEVLIVDNFDSFTYILSDYVQSLGFSCRVLRNNLNLDSYCLKDYKALVLSPGPNTPADSGELMNILHRAVGQLPVLGICLGHQAIGQYFGWTLHRAAQPMHGKTARIKVLHQQPFFNQLPQTLEVMRYHSLIIRYPSFSTPLNITAVSEQNEVMAICHQSLPIAGMQFHPESALTPNGKDMMRNWFKSVL